MRIACLVVILAACWSAATGAAVSLRPTQGPEKIVSAALPNAYRVTERVISGGAPQGEAGFAELQRLGVRTVISVDGAKPNVALAKKHGLRYVHLPHGYDGIPSRRLVELTKAIRELPGPLYVHCHHGKHRSPAAAAAACISAGHLTRDQGLALLAAAGTSPGYRGLFGSVRTATLIAPRVLGEADVEFRETVAVPPMADAMTAIEHTHDHLKQVAAAGWRAPADHADIDPPHEALLLREHYTELLRTEEVARQPREFQQLLRQSEANARELTKALRSGRLIRPQLDAQFARVTADCTTCHERFRDIPLDEKAAAAK